MAQSLKKMEQTLDTVLRSIHNPAMAAFASGMVTRSPSPSGGAAGSGNATAAAMARLPMMPDGQTGLPGIRSIDSGASSHAGPGPSGSHHPGFTGELSGHHLGGSNGSPASNGRSHPTFYAPPVLPGAHPPPYPIPQHAHYQQPHHLHHPSGASLHALPISSASSSSAGGPASGSAGNPPLPNPPPPQVPTRPHSPRLHSLPDNSLNPLGLLAEASLHNHRKIEARGVAAGMLVRNLLNHEPTLQQQAPTPASSHASGGRGGSVTASTPARDGAGAGSVAGSNAATAAVEEADDEEARRRAADDEAITNAAIAKVHRVMGRRPPAPVGHGGSSDLRSRPPSPTAGASGESGSAAPGRPSAAAAYTAAAANSAASGEPGSTAAGISSTNGDGKGKEQEARPVAGSREADAKAVKDEPAVEDDVPLGLASTVYFKPGPMTVQSFCLLCAALALLTDKRPSSRCCPSGGSSLSARSGPRSLIFCRQTRFSSCSRSTLTSSTFRYRCSTGHSTRLGSSLHALLSSSRLVRACHFAGCEVEQGLIIGATCSGCSLLGRL